MHDGHATHLRSPRPGRCLGPFPASGERKRSLISSPICVYLRMDTYHQATVHLDALFPCCLYGVLIDPFIDVVRLGQVLLVQRLDHFRDKALAEHGASARLLLPLLSVHRKNTYHTRQKFAPPWAAAGKDNALACGRREAQSAWSEMWATVRRERAPASLARQSGPRKRTRQSVEGGKRQRRAARLYERCLLRHGGGGYEQMQPTKSYRSASANVLVAIYSDGHVDNQRNPSVAHRLHVLVLQTGRPSGACTPCGPTSADTVCSRFWAGCWLG